MAGAVMDAYQTADQMHKALVDQGLGEEFVMRTVRTAFPAWKRASKPRKRKPRKKPEQPAEMPKRASLVTTDRAAWIKMGFDSKRLLSAIHKSHPRIMAHYAKQGLQVVYP